MSETCKEAFKKEWLDDSEGYSHYYTFYETAWSRQQEKLDAANKKIAELNEARPVKTKLYEQAIKENKELLGWLESVDYKALGFHRYGLKKCLEKINGEG